MKKFLLFTGLHASLFSIRLSAHSGHNCQSMALIKLGAFITEIRGKVGGTIFSKNKGGAYAKNRVMPSNPRTTAQQNIRGIFGALSSQWRSLNAGARESWNELAGSMSFQNSIGDSIKISGIALYQKFNGNLNTVGATFLEAPVALEGTTAVTINAFTMSADGTDVENTLTAVELSTSIPNTEYAVFATPPLSPGINNANNQLRLIGSFATLTALNTADAVAGLYEGVFGLPPVGSKVVLQVLPINATTGESGVPVQAEAIVALISG